MNIEFIEALKAYLLDYAKDVGMCDLITTVEVLTDKIDAFAASWPDSSDNPDNYPVTYHLRQYGCVTQDQLDEYFETGKIS